MTIVHAIMAILCVIAIVALVLFVLCRSMNMVDYVAAWVHSTKEEKVGLTRTKGHYNANGYLVNSESDIQLGTSGSFKRFDPVDKDVSVTMESTSFNGEWPCLEIDRSLSNDGHLGSFSISREGALIPDASSAQQEQSRQEQYRKGETSICPIPRPMSSINMADLTQGNLDFPLATAFPAQSFERKQISRQSTLQSQASSEIDEENLPIPIQKAVSCDTICSDTSVALDDLEDLNITGNLCIGFEYDVDYGELIVNILEAKDLKLPPHENGEVETYVKVFCMQENDASVQTKTYRSAGSPCYKERFIFPLNPRDQQLKTLSFQVFGVEEFGHYLIGEGDIRLADVSLRQPITTWVTLTDTGQQIDTKYGELLFSLSYLPTAERLTVVVVKARKLKFESEIGDSFVKVYLMQYGKKIYKKKTSIKKSESSPIFNEAMMFSVPIHTLQAIQLRLTVATTKPDTDNKTYSLGHVIIGSQATGRSLSHWNQMLVALRKPVAMWHPLRK